MKEIKEDRFKKREDIGFNPIPIASNPPSPSSPAIPRKKEGNVRSFERSNERTTATEQTYVVVIPKERRKTRQSFDIFEDQYDALKKLQVAEADKKSGRGGQKLGEMVQDALDSFIKDKAKKLGNIDVVSE